MGSAFGGLAGYKWILRELRREKMGMIGIGVIITVALLAILAPVLTPYPPSEYYRVHADFSAPSWASIFDPSYYPDQVPVKSAFETNDSVSDWGVLVTKWKERGVIKEPLENRTYEYSVKWSELGADTSGSMEISLLDNDTQEEEVDDVIWILVCKNFTWNYDSLPSNVIIKLNYMVRLKGYTFQDIMTGKITTDIYIIMRSNAINWTAFLESNEKTKEFPDWELTPFGFRIHDWKPTEVNVWKSMEKNLVNLLKIRYIFTKGTSVSFIIGFKIRIYSSGLPKTGEIALHVDDLEVNILSHYYGVLGTTHTGADLWTLILYGIRSSLLIAISATLISTAIGVTLGLFSGYFGGKIDEIIQRVIDFLWIIPGFPILLLLVWLVGARLETFIAVFIMFGWTGTAKLIRAQILSEKAKAYVEAAKAAGASDFIIMFKHILPNVLPIVFVQMSTQIAGWILSEAGIAYLLGAQVRYVSLGKLLYSAFAFGALPKGAWWVIVFPGIFIAIIGVAFIYLGTALDRILNPKLRAY